MSLQRFLFRKAAWVVIVVLFAALPSAAHAQIALTRIGGTASGGFNVGASEIPAFDPSTNRLFVVNALLSEVQVFNLADPTSPVSIGTINTSSFGSPNSVSVKNGILAVAVQNATKTNQGQAWFFNTNLDFSTPQGPASAVTVGALPDMLTFTPDGTRVLVANEAEPNSYGQGSSVDPEGSVSIINVPSAAGATLQTTIGFTSFNGQEAALRAAGVRIFGPGATAAQDFEPEYIAISPDGTKALVTLQENNAVARIDLVTNALEIVNPIVALGYKDHSLAGNGLDASDQAGDGIDIATAPVRGMYQPDSIASYQLGANTFYVTANEGDARDYTGLAEEVRVGNAAYDLNNTVFPNEATLKNNLNLGRLTVSNQTGNTDVGVAGFEEIHVFGARSFSIRDASGALVWDSGDAFEQILAGELPANFNADHTGNAFDNRSDNKGPEPEGVAIGEIDGRTYAFIGLERMSGIMVYDITDPNSPLFVDYISSRNFGQTPGFNQGGDLGPEGLLFVSAADSPNGLPLLIVGNEISGTTAIYSILPTPVPEPGTMLLAGVGLLGAGWYARRKRTALLRA